MVFEGRTQFSHHQGIGYEVQGKHEYPAENDLDSVEPHETVGYITESPNRRKCHKREHLPTYLFLFHTFSFY